MKHFSKNSSEISDSNSKRKILNDSQKEEKEYSSRNLEDSFFFRKTKKVRVEKGKKNWE